MAPARIASREIKARPPAPTSCKVSVPGALSSSRSFPDKVTPRSERLNPVAVAVNQISSPEGDHAAPTALAQRSVKSVFFPFRSTTLMVPPSSPRRLWSINAIRSPFAEKRRLPIHPGV